MSSTITSSTISDVTNPTLSASTSSALAASVPTAASAAASTGTTALGKLTSNYSDFLKMLMTQLKNQDPTSPMDTNAFTTELVQFSSVEQQINTNTSLTQLIQLTQSGQLLQSSSMVGHTVAVSGTSIPLQNSTGNIQFTTQSADSVTVNVYNGAGTLLTENVVAAKAGVNSWTWNGQDANGTTQPDGAYKITVTDTPKTGTTTALPFNVLGLATGVVKNGTNLQLQMGSVTTDFTNVQSVLS